MGFILKFLAGKFGMYALIAVAVALVGSLTYGAFQHQRAERYQAEMKVMQAEVKTLKANIESYKKSVESKDNAIESLKAALQKWVDWGKVMEAREEEAVKRSQQNAYQALLLRQKLQELEKADYAVKECLDYLSIDVARVCGGHAKSLRERAFSYDRASDGSASPRPEAPR